METLVKKLQQDLVGALEQIEGNNGKKFLRDEWVRKEGGYGISAVLQEGPTILQRQCI
jgi:coproporphyrinogen III oxidase